MKKAKLIHSRKLVIPEDFEPRLPNDYDEMFVNGYFHCHLSPTDWKARGYNLIDGHHRLEKAYRHGMEELPAYILPMEHHVGFIFKGYKEYADYWNGKLIDYEGDKGNKRAILLRHGQDH